MRDFFLEVTHFAVDKDSNRAIVAQAYLHIGSEYSCGNFLS